MWITNENSSASVNNGFGSVTVLSSTGQVTSGATGYSSGGLAYTAVVSAGGALLISSGGLATQVILQSGAGLTVKFAQSRTLLASLPEQTFFGRYSQVFGIR